MSMFDNDSGEEDDQLVSKKVRSEPTADISQESAEKIDDFFCLTSSATDKAQKNNFAVKVNEKGLVDFGSSSSLVPKFSSAMAKSREARKEMMEDHLVDRLQRERDEELEDAELVAKDLEVGSFVTPEYEEKLRGIRQRRSGAAVREPTRAAALWNASEDVADVAVAQPHGTEHPVELHTKGGEDSPKKEEVPNNNIQKCELRNAEAEYLKAMQEAERVHKQMREARAQRMATPAIIEGVRQRFFKRMENRRH